MAHTERDEVAELARALSSHLEWQRECGVTGLERSPNATSAKHDSTGRMAAPKASIAHASTIERARDVPIEPEPSVGGAPKFEMPAFLKKKGAAPSVPTAPVARVSPVASDDAAAHAPSGANERTPPRVSAAESARTPHEEALRRSPVTTNDAPRRTTLFAEPAPIESDAPRIDVPADFALVESIDAMPRLAGEERVRALRVLQEVARGCTRCRLHEGRTKSVFARGNPHAALAFVGEGPGRDEDLQGAPFVGAAGQLLDKIIAAMGLTIDDVYICNVVKCRPPNNRVPAPDEMGSCGPYLVNQLGMVRPQWIVALGKTAASYLLDSTESMTRLRGTWHTWQGIPLLATWHPAYLLRTPAAKKDTWEDMKLVLQRMGRSVPRGGGARSE
jgi:DNA polymerase